MICDFGLAKVKSAFKSGLTTTGFHCTLRYASPDAEDDGCATLASDVWAWGGLLLYVRIISPALGPLLTDSVLVRRS